LSATDFSATLSDLRCVYFFELRALVYFFSTIGAPVAFVPGFETADVGLGIRRRVQRSREAHPNSCCDDQRRAPAGFDSHWQSPHLPAHEAKRDPTACPQRGKKRESSGESGRKLGIAVLTGGQSDTIAWRNLAGITPADVSRTERCYEPA
jgi:hypothetical protein